MITRMRAAGKIPAVTVSFLLHGRRCPDRPCGHDTFPALKSLRSSERLWESEAVSRMLQTIFP